MSGNILAGNPHADRFGNAGVWHFYTEPVKGGEAGAVIPTGSLLARWQAAEKPCGETTTRDGPPAVAHERPAGRFRRRKAPTAALYRQLASLGGPLFVRAWPRVATQRRSTASSGRESGEQTSASIPSLFGKHPNGSPIEGASLCVQAPSVIEVHLPADLAAGTEFVTVGSPASADRPRGERSTPGADVQAETETPDCCRSP